MALQKLKTACNRDCPDICGLVATVEDGRVSKLEGDPEHPVTRGFLCHRTSRFLERQYSPERLTEPLLREGGILRPVSWDEALDAAARRLLHIREESGPASILHYRSGGSMGIVKAVTDYFFELFGPVAVKRGDVCSGAGDAAQETDFGEGESHDVFDVLNSRSVILWGKNPSVSSVHLLPTLKEAKRKGARLLLIDPVRQKTASLCERHIRVTPGADAALALGAASWLFRHGGADSEAPLYCDRYEEFRDLALSKTIEAWSREAGVDTGEVEAVARALAEKPCAILVGWGLGRRVNGSAAIRAIDALGAVSGNLGIPGGGVSYYFRRRRAFDLSFLQSRPPRTLCEPVLGREILAAEDPPVRAVWVTCGNPVASLPDSREVARAFETREFVVVGDSFLTDTARRATLVLPTTTLLEDEDVMGAYGHHYLASSRPVAQRPGGVKTDLEIAQALAEKVDALSGSRIAERIAGTHEAWKRRLLKNVEPLGVTLEAIESAPVRNPLAPRVLWPDRKFPTNTGRAKLVTAVAPAAPEEPGFALWLFSNAHEHSQCTQWADPSPQPPPATCNPEAAPGFRDGEVVWIESALGRMRARLRFDDAQRSDLVIVPKGGDLDAGTCANALVQARLTDAGEGAAYMDCKVRIKKMEESRSSTDGPKSS